MLRNKMKQMLGRDNTVTDRPVVVSTPPAPPQKPSGILFRPQSEFEGNVAQVSVGNVDEFNSALQNGGSDTRESVAPPTPYKPVGMTRKSTKKKKKGKKKGKLSGPSPYDSRTWPGPSRDFMDESLDVPTTTMQKSNTTGDAPRALYDSSNPAPPPPHTPSMVLEMDARRPLFSSTSPPPPPAPTNSMLGLLRGFVDNGRRSLFTSANPPPAPAPTTSMMFGMRKSKTTGDIPRTNVPSMAPPPLTPSMSRSNTNASDIPRTTQPSMGPPPLTPSMSRSNTTGSDIPRTTQPSMGPPPLTPSMSRSRTTGSDIPRTTQPSMGPPPLTPSMSRSRTTGSDIPRTNQPSMAPPPLTPSMSRSNTTGSDIPRTNQPSMAPPPLTPSMMSRSNTNERYSSQVATIPLVSNPSMPPPPPRGKDGRVTWRTGLPHESVPPPPPPRRDGEGNNNKGLEMRFEQAMQHFELDDSVPEPIPVEPVVSERNFVSRVSNRMSLAIFKDLVKARMPFVLPGGSENAEDQAQFEDVYEEYETYDQENNDTVDESVYTKSVSDTTSFAGYDERDSLNIPPAPPGRKFDQFTSVRRAPAFSTMRNRFTHKPKPTQTQPIRKTEVHQPRRQVMQSLAPQHRAKVTSNFDKLRNRYSTMSKTNAATAYKEWKRQRENGEHLRQQQDAKQWTKPTRKPEKKEEVSESVPRQPRESGFLGGGKTLATVSEEPVSESKFSSVKTTNTEVTAAQWSSATDPTTGREYWFNLTTMEASWEEPPSLAKMKRSNTTGSTKSTKRRSKKGKSIRASRLSRKLSKGSVSVNPQFESEQPVDLSRISGSSYQHGQPVSMRGAWLTVLDKASGDEYYVNTKTGETTWEKAETLI